jgi:hypothetical protein
MGKGTIGINPFYHDGTIMSHGAMAGLLSVIISFTDAKSCKSCFFFLLPTSFLLLLFTSGLWHVASEEVERARDGEYCVYGDSLDIGFIPT